MRKYGAKRSFWLQLVLISLLFFWATTITLLHMQEDPQSPSFSTKFFGQPALPRANRRLAIVMPFIHKQVDRLTGNMEKWQAFRGCKLVRNGDRMMMASGAKVSLVLYYDEDLDTAPPLADGRSVQQYFHDAWRALSPDVTSCFSGGIQFLSAKLSPENNQHPDGPCLQHFQLHELLTPAFDHFLQMEPDVLPIQDDWIDGLIEASHQTGSGGPCQQFWMKGSLSRCNGRFGEIANRRDFHMNGNALYCLGSPQFQDFIERVVKYYPPGPKTNRVVGGCSTGAWAEDGWDHTWYQFRQQPENFEYSKNVMHKFQYSTFIQNMCEDDYDPKELLSRDPGTVLVHSKFPFLNARDQFVRRAYNHILGRYAVPSERELMLQESEERVLETLCRSREHEEYLLRVWRARADRDRPNDFESVDLEAVMRLCMPYYRESWRRQVRRELELELEQGS